MTSESASRLLNAIIDQGLFGALSVIDEITRRLRGLTRKAEAWPDYLARARREIFHHEPLLALTLEDTLLAGWLTGADRAVSRLPRPEPLPTLLPSVLPPDLPPPFGRGPLAQEPGEPAPLIRFPIIEQAAADLFARDVMTRADFDHLADDARRTAFTVARISSVDAIEKIQEILVEDIAQGGTLKEFRTKLDETLGTSALAPWHVETVYRTNVATAYATGLDRTLNHPLVSDAFPYLEYHAVHDSRTDPDHLEMEKLGIQSTNVYRRDDPVWNLFFPPWRYNCRCMVIPWSLRDAARKGIREAQEWLRTGVPPTIPAWVPLPPFRPPPGWGTRPALAPVI
jgi:SPP1 gp7 family putative phage head morphogenesis protein